MTASTHWTTDAERGSALSLRLIVGVTHVLGRPIGRLLLFPVTAYFWVFSRQRRAASRAYLATVLGRPPKLGESYAHYLCFARVLLDRALLVLGHRKPFAVHVRNGETVTAALAEGNGCILLGAHFGAYDVLRAAAEMKHLRIKIMMRVETTQRFNAMIADLNPAWAQQVIPLGHVDSLLQAQEHLKSGGVLGMLGDRAGPQDKVVEAPFFGRPASFAAGPYLLARVLGAPVVAFFGGYQGGNRYDVWFERVDMAGDTAAVQARTGAAHFAAQLESACRSAPYNWFNFYDFWAKADRAR